MTREKIKNQIFKLNTVRSASSKSAEKFKLNEYLSKIIYKNYNIDSHKKKNS
jgi:hypothetical protein